MNLARSLVAWTGIGWALLAAAGFGGLLGWIGEGPANFVWVPVVAGCVACLILPGRQRWVGVAGLAGIVGLTAWPRPQLEPASGSGDRLTLMTWNCYHGRLDPEKAAETIAKSNPDVIGFTEITKGLRKALDARLRGHYPHYVGDPRGDFSGLVIYSKFPIRNWRRENDPGVWAVCDLALPDGRNCRTYLVHPPVPKGNGYFERARYLAAVAREIREEPGPVIVFGDFNATWASLDLRKFCDETGTLTASRFLPSWPVGAHAPLQVPIDHVLVTAADFGAVSAAIPSDQSLRSDHLPVVATIALRPRRKVAAVDGRGR